MADDRYVVMPVECTTCKTKQKVHIAAQTGIPEMSDHGVRCVSCNNYFKVRAPDRIIRGPFPA